MESRMRAWANSRKRETIFVYNLRPTQVLSRRKLPGVVATTDATANMRAVFEELLDHPELRPFISDGEPLPTVPLLRARAVTLCEMLRDAAEASLETATQVPGADEVLSGWPDWAAWVLSNSPGSMEHVSAHPAWCPRLRALHDRVGTD